MSYDKNTFALLPVPVFKFVFISVSVIELTDGDDQNIKALSEAIHNGKLSWSQTRVIHATTEDTIKTTPEAEHDISDGHSLHFKTPTEMAMIGK